jgi:hypothetical protein
VTSAPQPERVPEQPALQLIEADGDAGVCEDGYCHVPAQAGALSVPDEDAR